MATPHNTLPIGTERKQSSGYVLIKNPEHPLAFKNGGRRGWVARHRLRYYEHVQGEEQRCHYCGYGPMPWQGHYTTAINIDHINEIKGDDRLDNLTAACFWCNLLKSGWPLTHDEHQESIKRYSHIPPHLRPTPIGVLVEAWGIGPVDVCHNLELLKMSRQEGMF
jgi:hypothetical protein